MDIDEDNFPLPGASPRPSHGEKLTAALRGYRDSRMALQEQADYTEKIASPGWDSEESRHFEAASPVACIRGAAACCGPVVRPRASGETAHSSSHAATRRIYFPSFLQGG